MVNIEFLQQTVMGNGSVDGSSSTPESDVTIQNQGVSDGGTGDNVEGSGGDNIEGTEGATGTGDGTTNGSVDGAVDGSVDGAIDGAIDGAVDGANDGAVDGGAGGNLDGSEGITTDGMGEGSFDGSMGGGDMIGEVPVVSPKGTVMSSWPFVIGITSVTLVISVVIGILLAKNRIKKGFDLYED
ncbi:hypothetical protein [Lachnoclostridium sp.]|uniref:hypothetical protein n=1 Tax=Lachnoclostridium sp. TaxID=2028282 RepID=UPI00289904E6|nr:hypothetical protein [Lachnoclostridium sp.]